LEKTDREVQFYKILEDAIEQLAEVYPEASKIAFKKLWFVCQKESEIARMIRLEDFDQNFLTFFETGKKVPFDAVVIFYDNFFTKKRAEQRHVIFHEIAHFVLKHSGIAGTHEKEKEADDLARQWTKDLNQQRRKNVKA
jgi:hypothetical protein